MLDQRETPKDVNAQTLCFTLRIQPIKESFVQLTLTRPDDWHLHLRDGAALTTTVPDTARTFHRAIVMPNLKPAVETVEAALNYRERILAAVPEGMSFDPLMTLYLTPNVSPS